MERGVDEFQNHPRVRNNHARVRNIHVGVRNNEARVRNKKSLETLAGYEFLGCV